MLPLGALAKPDRGQVLLEQVRLSTVAHADGGAQDEVGDVEGLDQGLCHVAVGRERDGSLSAIMAPHRGEEGDGSISAITAPHRGEERDGSLRAIMAPDSHAPPQSVPLPLRASHRSSAHRPRTSLSMALALGGAT